MQGHIEHSQRTLCQQPWSTTLQPSSRSRYQNIFGKKDSFSRESWKLPAKKCLRTVSSSSSLVDQANQQGCLAPDQAAGEQKSRRIFKNGHRHITGNHRFWVFIPFGISLVVIDLDNMEAIRVFQVVKSIKPRILMCLIKFKSMLSMFTMGPDFQCTLFHNLSLTPYHQYIKVYMYVCM